MHDFLYLITWDIRKGLSLMNVISLKVWHDETPLSMDKQDYATEWILSRLCNSKVASASRNRWRTLQKFRALTSSAFGVEDQDFTVSHCLTCLPLASSFLSTQSLKLTLCSSNFWLIFQWVRMWVMNLRARKTQPLFVFFLHAIYYSWALFYFINIPTHHIRSDRQIL